MSVCRVGETVRAARDDGEEEEEATIVALDSADMRVTLRFSDGYVRKHVPVAALASDAVSGALIAERKYTAPAPPTAAELASPDSQAPYAYIGEYKAVGNALFAANEYADAIVAYTDAVAALARHCYPSHERMLWDYAARVPCAQCFSNAALCALKLGDHARAAELCERALARRACACVPVCECVLSCGSPCCGHCSPAGLRLPYVVFVCRPWRRCA